MEGIKYSGRAIYAAAFLMPASDAVTRKSQGDKRSPVDCDKAANRGHRRKNHSDQNNDPRCSVRFMRIASFHDISLFMVRVECALVSHVRTWKRNQMVRRPCTIRASTRRSAREARGS